MLLNTKTDVAKFLFSGMHTKCMGSPKLLTLAVARAILRNTAYPLGSQSKDQHYISMHSSTLKIFWKLLCEPHMYRVQTLPCQEVKPHNQELLTLHYM